MTFAEDFRARLPEGMELPPPIAEAMDWVEAQGWTTSHDRPRPHPLQQKSLFLYPPDQAQDPAASLVTFCYEPGPPLHEPPPEVMARIVKFASAAGDGGCLSFWVDDNGQQRIVLFDHGMPFVLTDDPLVALQFLAMGYPEPAALNDATLSPAAYALAEGYDPPLLPTAFRTFLEDRFALSIPNSAADLGITIPSDTASDPVRDWLSEVMPEPELGHIPGFTPENPFVITAELREIVGEDGIAGLRAAYPYIVEAENP